MLTINAPFNDALVTVPNHKFGEGQTVRFAFTCFKGSRKKQVMGRGFPTSVNYHSLRNHKNSRRCKKKQKKGWWRDDDFMIMSRKHGWTMLFLNNSKCPRSLIDSQSQFVILLGGLQPQPSHGRCDMSATVCNATKNIKWSTILVCSALLAAGPQPTGKMFILLGF